MSSFTCLGLLNAITNSIKTWHVPDVVWGAIISLLGVLIANWHSRGQMRRQLKHDSHEKSRERLMALRRDVYLPAVEAMAQMTRAIGMMSDVDIEDREITKLISSTTGTIEKIILIASQDTINKVLDFQSAFLKAHIKLSPARWRLRSLKKEIDNVQAEIETCISDRERWLEVIKQHNVQKNPDGEIFERLQRQLSLAGEYARQLTERHTGLQKNMGKEQLEYLDKCMEASAELAKFTPSAMIAARCEIELPIDQQEFTTAYNRYLVDSSNEVRKLAAAVRKIAESSAESEQSITNKEDGETL